MIYFIIILFPLTTQFYLKSNSKVQNHRKPWGFNLYEDNQVKDLEELKQFEADNFNFSEDFLEKFQNQNNNGGGVQFSITNSLDVLRQRMLGAIRRNQQQNNKVKNKTKGIKDARKKQNKNHICTYQQMQSH